ncbi:unnamed protein product [Rotaria socialis]|uniref:Glucosamine/galactosamine-6-phosphate isomerase domain-containing protein n=1 Tax=Rotaria socialis TaxID=392032 RepID=A0A817RQN0_9BILA|nr:unnamed protein product [Rotaria socialis]CAF3408329.1 unnamed protein product [Rotaria socialis]
MSSAHMHVTDDNDSLAEMLGYLLEQLILHKLNKNQIITIGLSGGSLVDLLASMLPRLQLPWTYDSTYGNYQSKLFRQLPLTENNIIKIDPNLETVEECAKDYQNKLQEALNDEDKSFDIVLLGMGPDGYIASLFSNHSAVNINQGVATL